MHCVINVKGFSETDCPRPVPERTAEFGLFAILKANDRSKHHFGQTNAEPFGFVCLLIVLF